MAQPLQRITNNRAMDFESPTLPAIIKVQGEFLGEPNTQVFNSDEAFPHQPDRAFFWRVSMYTPVNDHCLIYLDLLSTLRQGFELLATVVIPSPDINSITEDVLDSGALKTIYRAFDEMANPSLPATIMTLTCRRLSWLDRRSWNSHEYWRPVDDRLRDMKSKFESITGDITLTIFFPIKSDDYAHKLATWIASLQKSRKNEHRPSGTFGALGTKGQRSRVLDQNPRSAPLPDCFASAKSTPQFWSKDQHVVYLQYGLAYDHAHRIRLSEAASGTFKAAVIPLDLSSTATHKQYLIVLELAADDARLVRSVRTSIYLGPPYSQGAEHPEEWFEIRRFSAASSLCHDSRQIYVVSTPASHNNGILQLPAPSDPLDKRHFPIHEFRRRLLAGKFDRDVKLRPKTPDEAFQSQAKALQQLLGPKSADGSVHASQGCIDAIKDYRTMRPRNLRRLDSRIPAIQELLSSTKNLPEWIRSHVQALSNEQQNVIKTSAFSRYFFIPIAGCPSSGKTTISMIMTLWAAMNPLRRTFKKQQHERSTAKLCPTEGTDKKDHAQVLLQASSHEVCDNMCLRYTQMAKKSAQACEFRVIRLLDEDENLASGVIREWSQRTSSIDTSSVKADTEPAIDEIQRVAQLIPLHPLEAHNTKVQELTLETFIVDGLLKDNDFSETERGLRKMLVEHPIQTLAVDATFQEQVEHLAGHILSTAHVVVGTPVAVSHSRVSRNFHADICVHEVAGRARETDTMSLIAGQDPLACFVVGNIDRQTLPTFLRGSTKEEGIEVHNPFAAQLATSLLQRMTPCGLVTNWLPIDRRIINNIVDTVACVFYKQKEWGMKTSLNENTKKAFRRVMRENYNEHHHGSVVMLDIRGFT